VIYTRVVRAEEYVVNAEREAGEYEDACRHYALRAPLRSVFSSERGRRETHYADE
jgi:hypothetical protein